MINLRLLVFAAICVFVATGSLSAQTTATFQQGVDGYTGTFDRLINLTNRQTGSEVDTTTSSFFIDGDPNDAFQSWVNSDMNNGIAIMSDHTDNDDGWTFTQLVLRKLLSVR